MKKRTGKGKAKVETIVAVESEQPRIVILDIETAPLSVYCWGLWEENVGIDQVNEEWTILSFSYKVLGSKKVFFYCTGGRGASKVRDDRALLDKLWTVLDEADIVVTQNGKAFDIKKINARMVMAGMKPYSPIKVIDTKIEAKRQFSFSSNRLEWLSKHLTDIPKSKHKKFPGFELWAECLLDNPEAWREMELYNKIDVLSDEAVYMTMRPWMEGHPNVAAYSHQEIMMCPKCGSQKIQKRGKSRTQTGEYHRFQCQECGGWSRSRQVINTTAKRKSLLTN